MDRAMYLQAMREQDPEQFKRLCKSGELEQFVLDKMREAAQIFEDITHGLPRDSLGNL